MFNKLTRWLVVGVLCLLTPLSYAEQAVKAGDFTIHYSALKTGFLTPEVAKNYGIVRSKQRAMLTISVRKGEVGNDMAVPAEATAKTVNLTKQLKNISLKQVKDGDALYYIGTFKIHNEETLDFTLNVTPEGYEGAPVEINFRQQFFED
ncbi:DUF4426 domain-containing protein [Candidatus Albibeggiatoa sp. nov. NOAA]|uniref:DUF4426 domain-containing protein n=1 Tax=Candidatus Albibeggiatoa sp. nov. NOAA TaxID=3162724 RepID=UPI0032F5938F|nr:DUF4426 domain-containing protein [Thiotrichaceae bacterium]